MVERERQRELSLTWGRESERERQRELGLTWWRERGRESLV